MKKRILSVFLAAMIACSVFAGLSVSAAETKVDSTASDATSGTCGKNLSYNFEKSTGTLTISGTGDMWNAITFTVVTPSIEGVEEPVDSDEYYINTPWYEFKSDIKSVVIKNGVTSIGNFAFASCTNLTNITIPNSVTDIRYMAFYFCNNLTSITIPNSVASIGEYAFLRCSSLKSITIPNSVTSIGKAAFGDCTGLTDINVDSYNKNYSTFDGNLYNKELTELIQYAEGKKDESFAIPNNITSIGSGAFEGCTSLKSITIPDSITSISSYAFCNCTNLTSITIPNSVTSIGNCAFNGCTSLTSITIPNSVTSIEIDAFSYCTNLTSVTIPNSVTSIEEAAFYKCNKLSDVYYKGTKSQWNKVNIDNSDNSNDPLLNAKIHCKDGTITPAKKTTVTLAKSSATLYRTGKTTIKATVKNGKGKTTYKSSNTKVAKVSSKGVVTAVKKGTAKITVTNNGVKKTFKVTVKNPKLNATKKTLKVKKSFTLKITGKVGTAKFTSSNKKVATVNSKGKITAKKKGTAYITVKTNGIKLKCKVTVKK